MNPFLGLIFLVGRDTTETNYLYQLILWHLIFHYKQKSNKRTPIFENL